MPSVYDDVTVECCLDCRQRYEDDGAADAHYSLTGHEMGYPLGENWWEWPKATWRPEAVESTRKEESHGG